VSDTGNPGIRQLPRQQSRLMPGAAVPPLALGLVIVAVTVLVPMRRVPLTMRMGRAGPSAADPGVMPWSPVPVATNPYIIRAGPFPNDHVSLWRGWRRLKNDIQRDPGQNCGGRSRGDRKTREGEKT